MIEFFFVINCLANPTASTFPYLYILGGLRLALFRRGPRLLVLMNVPEGLAQPHNLLSVLHSAPLNLVRVRSLAGGDDDAESAEEEEKEGGKR
jgi:hypothetical protein